MVDSREKGARAEREVAALLVGWWCRREPGTRFVRSPGSGGWATADVRAEFRASGDLMTTAAEFPWSVEVKRRERFVLSRVAEGRQSPVWRWWWQACGAAHEAGVRPMLWLRASRAPWVVVLSDSEPIDRALGGRYRRVQWQRVVMVDAEALLQSDPGHWI